MLEWGFSTSTGGAIRSVPLSPDVEMGIEQDFERKVAWAWIDTPTTGRLVTGPFRFTPYENNPSFIDVRYGGSASGPLSYLSGRIDHWSLEPLPDIRADINDDGVLNVADVDLLSLIIRRNGTDAVADLSIDGKVDQTDLGIWIHEHRKSYFGDANLDGQFDSQDLTLVFQAGEYEDLIADNSGWADGDWNADAEFTSSDLVLAFQDGGYEKGRGLRKECRNRAASWCSPSYSQRMPDFVLFVPVLDSSPARLSGIVTSITSRQCSSPASS